MTTGLLTTAGLVGLFMAVVHARADQLRHDALRQRADRLVDGAHGVLAAHRRLGVPGRSVTATALTSETFDNRHLNWTALAEIVLAVLITQMDVMRPAVRDRAADRATVGCSRWCPPLRCSSSGSSAS